MELDISEGFDRRIHELKHNRSLSEIISMCEKSYSSDSMASLVHDFICSYSSIDETLTRHRIVSGDSYEISKSFSILNASVASMNSVKNQDVESVMNSDAVTKPSYFSYSDFDFSSDYSLLSNVLTKMSSIPKNQNENTLRFQLYSFFDDIRINSKRHLRNAKTLTKSKLNNIQIKKNGLDFKYYTLSEKKVKVGNFSEDVSLPLYTPDSSANLNDVIGNNDGMKILRAAIIRALKYDKEKRQNMFFSQGLKIPDAYLLFGNPGVGKTYGVDAVVNHFVDTFSEYDDHALFVDFSEGLKSSYMNENSKILEQYVDKSNSLNMPVICIIDEADGVVAQDDDGNKHAETKKVIREFKDSIGHYCKDVYIWMTNYPGNFEAALGHRFNNVYMEGFTTAEHFKKSFEKELGCAVKNFSDSELKELADMSFRINKEFEEFRVHKPSMFSPYFNGRNIRQICSSLTTGNYNLICENEDQIRRCKADQFPKLLEQMTQYVTFETLKNEINKTYDGMAETIKFGGI